MLSEQELIRLEQLGSTLFILAFSALIVAGEIGLKEIEEEESGESSGEMGLTSDEVVVVSAELRVLGAFLLGIAAAGRLSNLENTAEGRENPPKISNYRTITAGEWISTFGDYLLLIGTLRQASLGITPTVIQ